MRMNQCIVDLQDASSARTAPTSVRPHPLALTIDKKVVPHMSCAHSETAALMLAASHAKYHRSRADSIAVVDMKMHGHHLKLSEGIPGMALQVLARYQSFVRRGTDAFLWLQSTRYA
jgi:hypothetical protein